MIIIIIMHVIKIIIIIIIIMKTIITMGKYIQRPVSRELLELYTILCTLEITHIIKRNESFNTT